MSKVYIQIGAGAGDLDYRTGCRDGFTEYVKKLPKDTIKRMENGTHEKNKALTNRIKAFLSKV